MSSVRNAVAALALLAAAVAPRAVHAQGNDPYVRGEELEQREEYEQAAAAYREALARSPVSVPALLGLERVYAQLGRSAALLPILDTAIAHAPRVAAFRAAQLRTLRMLGDRDGVRAAFDRWRREVPRDPAPYREYARMLIQDGLTGAADTVLRQAQAALGSGRGFAYELAQLRAASGQWESAARSWRQAVADNPYLDQAAVFSLLPTPAASRDSVRRALRAPPPTVAPLKVLALLEVSWGSPRSGWDVLHRLPPDTAALAVWLEFARRAEEGEAWLVARDALVAVNAERPSPALAARAAADALNGGDAASAVTLATSAERTQDSASAALSVVPVHLRALGALGRPEEGERLLAAYDPYLRPEQRARFTQVLAWGWVRRGDLDKAKRLLAAAGADDGLAEGWLALYDGDLATARKQLKPSPDAPPELLTALALLERTTKDRAPDVGEAFLTLARGDTLAAATAFERAATSLPEAGSLLRATAARLFAARRAMPRAVALWKSILESTPEAPEAPEAELEWARTLRRDGQTAAAVERLEHLILTYPQSALVPQARRELELARHAVPNS